MNKEEIFSLSLDIGQEIIKSGGEIHRAKDTILRINRAYDNDVKIFALPNLIIGWCEGKVQLRQIKNETTDLSEIARLNDFSRRLCFENNEEVNITRKKVYSKFWDIAAVASATSSFCLFFGGTITDALFSALIGMLITFSGYKKINLPIFSSNLIDSFISGFLAHIPKIIGADVHPDKIIIGTIMLLVPGLTVVNAMRDMMSGDFISGFVELLNAVMSALAIAFGIAGAIMIFS